MPRPRPSALALIVVFTVASLAGPAGAGVAVAARATCTGANDRQPPSTIRVLRKVGPAAGTVQTVDFWQYVGTVLRTEFSGPNWTASTLRVGAQAVKQYAWYHSIYWRGGMINGECFDVKDSTADQLYRPEKLVNGIWVLKNEPGQTHLEAMAATWHIHMRKDFLKLKKKPNKMFVTGYRSGKKNYCGYEDGWFRLFQKSLRDCGAKGLTIEEMWRTYHGQNWYIVDVRDRDVLRDDAWRGDVGMLTPSGGQTAITFFGASDNGFDAPVGETVGLVPDDVLDQGVGDVTGVDVPADDLSTDNDAYRTPRAASNLADVVLLAKSGSGAGRKVWVVKSTGNPGDHFDAPTVFDAPDGVARLLVADFDGDMNADVGLLRSTPTEPGPTDEPTLYVMRSLGNGSLGNPIPWWRGSVDLDTQAVMAGDVNSDGKADLIITNGNGFLVAPSTPSCLSMSPRGACPSLPANRMDGAQDWLPGGAGWTLGTARFAVGDKDRDGRDDVFVVVKDGSGVKVFAMRTARAGGSFVAPDLMWQGSGLDFDSVRPVAFHGDLDGFADLAMLQNTSGGGTAFWLRSAAASMSPVGTPAIGNGTGWGAARAL